MEFLFYLTGFLLIYPLILYPLSLILLDKVYGNIEVQKDLDFKPEIDFVITAYNEEKVIVDKLFNVINQDYPKKKMNIIVASDGSSDDTNQLVIDFSKNHPDYKIKLLCVDGRRGKTHAQNLAVADGTSEILVFSDANSMWNTDATSQLISRFVDEKIGYLSGKLQYINSSENSASSSESSYWNLDLKLRAIESKVCSTVGGNGAIYAVRRIGYVDLPDILSHDGFFPTKMVLQGLTAKFEPFAIASEKAGDTCKDEFKRKVRMQRGQPWKKYYDSAKFNVFKYGWFSYFYLGHKYLKYQLYLFHLILLFTNYMIYETSPIYGLMFICQCLFYVLAIMGWLTGSRSKILYVPYYYTMTIVAQAVSVYNTLTGKSKSIWEKAESTR